jgi:glycine/D-amino acid oxidase-like deaminating enzyme
LKSPGPRIAVIGAGIVGASVAYHLARRGAAVTLVDKGPPGAGVTGTSFAWINVSHGLPGPYARLRRLALEEYRRLERDLESALRVDWCGALTWQGDPAETERFVRAHAAAGHDVRLIERAEIARLEPGLIEPPARAALAAGEGAVGPVEATAVLVEAARHAGADVRLATEVTAIAANGQGVTGIRAKEGNLEAEVVVLAAGTGAGALCGPLGLDLPLDPSPALLLRFRTPGRLVHRIVSTPDLEIRQADEKRLLAAEDYIDDSPENGPAAIALRALAAVKKRLRGAGAVTLEEVSVGQRPMPGDGTPIIGFCAGVEGLYVAVMHAGVTLAPAVGRFAAGEILDGAEAEALAPCRLDRFAAGPP